APPRAVRAGFPPGHRPAHVAVAQDHDQLRVPAPGGQDHPDAAPGRRVTDAPGRSPSSVDDVLSEYGGLEAQLSDPALHEDPAAARRVGKRFAELTPVVQTHQALASARDDLAAARELADDDASFADEAERLAAEAETLEAKLADLLAPRDPHDADDVLMEIKSGEGGEESALFASELARMYTRYAEKHGWVVQTLGATESDLGGVKDASLSIRARQPSRDGVWSRLKFEGRPPCAARPGDRVPGARAHIGCGGAGLPRARGRRPRGDRRVRSEDRRVPVVRQGRPGRQHHRLRGPDHPPAHRHRRHVSERARSEERRV